ncbi:hypothetical protein Droror1_Dr00001698 [Drosera rotundifolia]
MALRLCALPPHRITSPENLRPLGVVLGRRRLNPSPAKRSVVDEKRKRGGVRVRSSLEVESVGGGTEMLIGQVTEVDKDTFWPIVNGAGDKTIVLDMYTQWCGPCKVIAPKFQELSKEYLDVVFLKLDCNQENRPLAKELGIKVVPTFKILKGGKVIKEVTGAKIDDLVAGIEAVRSS